MANLHYAEIGDVWKHLVLAEVLAVEAPSRYLESHSGSSSYPLTFSPERKYGALRFASRSAHAPSLEGSVYRRLLARYGGGTRARYPGSPLIALSLLGGEEGRNKNARFNFCDLDGGSLSTISGDAQKVGVAADRLRLVEGDGISEINRELADLRAEDAAATFLHADPYQPLERGNDGATSLDLVRRAAALGTKCMLWYGFDSVQDRDDLRVALREGVGGERPPWYGEIFLRADSVAEIGFDPGVLGCGIVLCNVHEETLEACARLGEGLASIYAGARLPNGTDGSLSFESGVP